MTTTKLNLCIALSSFVLLTSACDDGYNFPYCEETVTELDADATTPSGHSVAEILETISGERQTTLVYPAPEPDSASVEHTFSDAEATALTLALTPLSASKLDPKPGSVRWIDAEEVYPTSGAVPAIAIHCPDRLEIDAKLGFSTLDGAFDELLDVTVNAALDWEFDQDIGYAEVILDYDPDALAGDLRVESVEPANPTRVDHTIRLRYALTDVAAEREGATIGEPFGSVDGGVEHDGGDWVSYAYFMIAAFGEM